MRSLLSQPDEGPPTADSSPGKTSPEKMDAQDGLKREPPTSTTRAVAALADLWSTVEIKCPWFACCGCREKSTGSDSLPPLRLSMPSRSFLDGPMRAFPELDEDPVDVEAGQHRPKQMFDDLDGAVVIEDLETLEMPSNERCQLVDQLDLAERQLELAVIEELSSPALSSRGGKRSRATFSAAVESVRTTQSRIVARIERAIEESQMQQRVADHPGIRTESNEHLSHQTEDRSVESEPTR